MLTPSSTRAEVEQHLGRKICGEPDKGRPRYGNAPLCCRTPIRGRQQCYRHLPRGIENPNYKDGKRTKAKPKMGGGGPTPLHTDAVKAQAVVIARLSGDKSPTEAAEIAAKALGLPRSTVQSWVRGEKIGPRAKQMTEDAKKAIADKIARVADKGLDEIDSGRLPFTTVTECLQAVDRLKIAQLLTGEPTENIAGSLSPEELSQLRAEVRSKLNDSRTAPE